MERGADHRHPGPRPGSPAPRTVRRVAAALLRHEFAARLLAAVPPATIEALVVLRARGWRTGLVSNATADTARAWPGSPLAGLMDVAVFSYDVHVAKPDPRIYLAAVNGLGGLPTECVYVGDGADRELPGAASLGMAVARTIEHADNDPGWAGATIDSFGRLPDLIGRPAARPRPR